MNHRKTCCGRDFTLVVAGQIISLFGNAILRFALPEYFTSRDPERNAVPLHWFFFANHRFAFGIH